jgi:hypothetical protein
MQSDQCLKHITLTPSGTKFMNWATCPFPSHGFLTLRILYRIFLGVGGKGGGRRLRDYDKAFLRQFIFVTKVPNSVSNKVGIWKKKCCLRRRFDCYIWDKDAGRLEM